MSLDIPGHKETTKPLANRISDLKRWIEYSSGVLAEEEGLSVKDFRGRSKEIINLNTAKAVDRIEKLQKSISELEEGVKLLSKGESGTLELGDIKRLSAALESDVRIYFFHKYSPICKESGWQIEIKVFQNTLDMLRKKQDELLALLAKRREFLLAGGDENLKFPIEAEAILCKGFASFADFEEVLMSGEFASKISKARLTAKSISLEIKSILDEYFANSQNLMDGFSPKIEEAAFLKKRVEWPPVDLVEIKTKIIKILDSCQKRIEEVEASNREDFLVQAIRESHIN